MSDKVYLGLAVSNLDTAPAFDPISRITILVDEENVYTAGDDSGRELELTCPWATQTMADDLLDKLKGFVYQPYSAQRANLDPSAELGDAVTVGGKYAPLLHMVSRFDAMCVSDIEAPSDEEINHEYPYESHANRELTRKFAQTRAMITVTANTIRQEVTDSLNQLSASITVELDSVKQEIVGLETAHSEMELSLSGLTTRIQDAEGNIANLELTTQNFGVSIEGLEGGYADLALTLDGLTYTDGNGTVWIDGSGIKANSVTATQIDATNLKVAAANITGELVIGQLPSNVAVTGDIPTRLGQLTNDTGYQTSSGVTSIVKGTITTDYINALGISVAAANISGELTFNQLPSTVAETGDIPTKVSQLTNDSGYQTATNVGTIISNKLVASPTIAGGVFGDLDYRYLIEGEDVNTSWIKMGSATSGGTHIGYLYQYYSGYSDTDPICRMGYYAMPGYYDQWVMAPFGYIALSYLLDDYGNMPGRTMYAQGNWNFSQATVTGLNVSSDITVTAVWG